MQHEAVLVGNKRDCEAMAKGVWLVLMMLSGPVLSTAGQSVRPPELNMQFHRAETAWKTGASMLEAKARVDRVLSELPNDVEALKLRARVLLELGRVEEAFRDAQRAVQLRPEDGEAHLILCEAARRSGRRAQAEQALNDAARLVLDDALLHVRLSWNAVLLDKLDKAEAFARIARALDPTEAAGYYQLARVFVLKDQVDAAALVLSEGLRQALLDPRIIASDTVLVRTLDHPSLQELVRR